MVGKVGRMLRYMRDKHSELIKVSQHWKSVYFSAPKGVLNKGVCISGNLNYKSCVLEKQLTVTVTVWQYFGLW